MNASELVSLGTAADWFPYRGGRKTSVASLTNWIETGRNGVFLRATKSGGQWFTSREWVESFLKATDAPPKPKASRPVGRRPRRSE